MPVLAPRTVAAAKPSILTPALRQSFFDTRPTWGVCVLATVLNGGVNTRNPWIQIVDSTHRIHGFVDVESSNELLYRRALNTPDAS